MESDLFLCFKILNVSKIVRFDTIIFPTVKKDKPYSIASFKKIVQDSTKIVPFLAGLKPFTTFEIELNSKVF